MGAERFVISSINPNEAVGGGGCACSVLKNEDAAGPFFVFPHTETANNLSPHTVVCAGCVRFAVDKLDKGVEQLAAGEPDVIGAEDEDLVL